MTDQAARSPQNRPLAGRAAVVTGVSRRVGIGFAIATRLAQAGSLAAHLAPRRITVNTINPGATDTGYATPDLCAAVCAQEPMGRWGEPDDAARLIAWLATDDARWITGQVINSTGGGP